MTWQNFFTTSIMKCCYSGTVLNLPYNYKADFNQTAMEANENYDFYPMMAIVGVAASMLLVGGNNGNYGGGIFGFINLLCS